MEDTQKNLERLQRELINEESDRLDALLEEFLEEPMPAFEDPDATAAPDEPVFYRNYSNDYGAEPQEPVSAETDVRARKRKKDDRTIVALMIIASVECVGILGVLAYWLKIFL